MILDLIADRADAWRRRPLTLELEHHSCRAVLDWLGAAIAGSVMPPATLLVNALGSELDRGKASLVPSGRLAAPRAAALINATASHTAEVDDIFRDGIYHPGCPTIGAALAAAQAADADGDRFLRAVAVGYEVGTRIAAAVNPQHYRFWHTTGTVGALGGAVGAAVALDADRREIAEAVATATTFASGLQQAFRSEAMSKPLHAGHAADVGILAAMAALQGVTGARDVLDGPAGFAAAMAEGADLEPAFLEEEMGNVTRVTFKAHAACGHTFAAIDAALELATRHGLDHGQVRKVKVSTYSTALQVAGNPAPVTPFEAKFSLQYTVAAALVLGHAQLEAFSISSLEDQRIRRLVSLVEAETEPDLDAMFPGRRAARVSIELDDGRTVEHLAPTRRGDPDAPLSDEELESKFLRLAGPVVGEEDAARMAKGVWNLGSAASVLGLGTVGS